MKTRLILGFAIAILTIGCSKNDETEKSTINQEEATINAKIDIANDDVSNIVEEQESNSYANTSGRYSDSSTSLLSDCAYITRVPAFGTPLTPGETVTKTIDFSHFSADGCTLANGNVLKGKVIITFVFQPNAPTHTITYTFDNFYHNAIKIVGTKTFTRVMSVATANSPSHPIVTMNMDFTATFPNGNSYTRVGQRVREIVQGFGTSSWTDNVFKVTGSWTTSFPNTTVQTSTITSPLLVKMSCVAENKPLLVQGVITFTRNNSIATLDYGNGICDNIAVFTINGNSYTIVIGN